MNFKKAPGNRGSSPSRDGRPQEGLIPNPRASLREQVREVMRFHHYALRTERAYWHWIVRFLRHHREPGRTGSAGWCHPKTLGVAEVAGFLSHLAKDRQVAASTQNPPSPEASAGRVELHVGCIEMSAGGTSQAPAGRADTRGGPEGP